MSVVTLSGFTLSCDECGKQHCCLRSNSNGGWGTAEEAVKDAVWWHNWTAVDGKHYCHRCTEREKK